MTLAQCIKKCETCLYRDGPAGGDPCCSCFEASKYTPASRRPTTVEYIERGAAINEIYRFDGYIDDDMEWRLHYALKKLPAADVVEVRHGRWIDKNRLSNMNHFQYWICSCCGYARSSNWDWEKSEKPQVKYCENCGAKMDGGQDE